VIDGILERFAAALRNDERILAAFLYGSHAAGTADQHSDVDLCIITADAARDDVWAQRGELVRQLGEPLLLEDFDDDATVNFSWPTAPKGS
jgi:predicted nucleotidyltransferase